MDLWIRSQDRETLIKTENVSIDSENYIIGNLISDDNKSVCDYWRLGHYKTKERALEVLDEIQKLLTPKIIIKNEGRDCVALDGTIYRTNIVSNINSDIQQLSTYVYEIPKE